MSTHEDVRNLRDSVYKCTVKTEQGVVYPVLYLDMKNREINVAKFETCERIVRQQLRERDYTGLELTSSRFVWEDEDGLLVVQYKHCQAPIEWEE